jgi:hypothetical protein
MVKLLGREAGLLLVPGLAAMFLIPSLLDKPVAVVLFWVGILMGLTFMAIYALAVLIGRPISSRVRGWMGAFAWVSLFWMDLVFVGALIRSGASLTPEALYLQAAPGLLGLLPSATAAWSAPIGRRGEAAASALFAYSIPMMVVKWGLAPLVSSSALADVLAVHCGALYLSLRVLVGALWPFSVEGGAAAGPLVYRPVPDAIVGLVEATTRLRALPFATIKNGERDEGAISVRCPAGQVEELRLKLQTALLGKPFLVQLGHRADARVEIVIRPEA